MPVMLEIRKSLKRLYNITLSGLGKIILDINITFYHIEFLLMRHNYK